VVAETENFLREGVVLGTQGGPTTPRDTVVRDNVEENLLNAGAAR
jgi:hypothetical protein